MGSYTYNGRTYSTPDSSSKSNTTSSGSRDTSGGVTKQGLSWRDPNSGTIYYNIDHADSSYQTDRINGGAIPSNATYNPSAVYKASVNAKLSPNAPSVDNLLSGNFHINYITGNSLAGDPRFTNSQKAMIESNFWAKQNGNVSPFSIETINAATNGGFVGGTYGPGNARYAYVTPYEEGGQNYISPTIRTDKSGNSVQYRGYANEPGLGAYNNGQGKQLATDMNYSWERAGNLRSGNLTFNADGANSAMAKALTRKLESISGNTASKTVKKETANSPMTTNTKTASTSEQILLALKDDPQIGLNEISRAQKVYQEKMASGDVEGANAAHRWANQIRQAMGVADQYDLNTGAPIQLASPSRISPNTVESTPSDDNYIENMQGFIDEQKQAYLEQQQAMLAAERDRVIAELEQNYEEQIAEGKISVREAETALEEQKKEIDKEYYQASQKIQLYAQEMGIQNSQQMVGLMQTTDVNNAELQSKAKSEYTKRVADIQDRINAITKQKNIGVANANSAYNNGMLNANSTASLNASNSMMDLMKTEHQNQITQENSVANILLQHKLQLEQMIKNGEITEAQAEKEFEREKEKMKIQYGYDTSLTSMRSAGDRGSSGSSGFEQTLLNNAAMYGIDPNNLPKGKTLAQAVKDAETADGDKQLRHEQWIKIQNEKYQKVINAGKPKKPKRDDFYGIMGDSGEAKYNSAMKTYDAKMKLWNTAVAWFNK